MSAFHIALAVEAVLGIVVLAASRWIAGSWGHAFVLGALWLGIVFGVSSLIVGAG